MINIEFHGSSLVEASLEAAPKVFQVWSSVLGSNLVTIGGYVIRDYQEDIKKRGITSLEYAIASLIHEFLHAIGKFPPDTRRTVYADGSVKTESKSMANQKKVLDNCFGKGGAK